MAAVPVSELEPATADIAKIEAKLAAATTTLESKPSAVLSRLNKLLKQQGAAATADSSGSDTPSAPATPRDPEAAAKAHQETVQTMKKALAALNSICTDTAAGVKAATEELAGKREAIAAMCAEAPTTTTAAAPSADSSSAEATEKPQQVDKSENNDKDPGEADSGDASALSDELRVARKELKSLQEEKEELRADYQDAVALHEKSTKENVVLKKKAAEATKALEEAKAKVATLEKEKEASGGGGNDDGGKLAGELKVAKMETESLRADLNTARDEAEAATEKLEQCEAKHKSDSDALRAEHKKQLAALEKQLSGDASAMTDLKTQLEQLEKDREADKAAAEEKMSAATADLQKLIADLEAKIKAMEAAAEEEKQSKEALQAECRTHLSTIAERDQTIADLEAAVARKDDDLKQEQANFEQLERQSVAEKAAMQAAHDERYESLKSEADATRERLEGELAGTKMRLENEVRVLTTQLAASEAQRDADFRANERATQLHSDDLRAFQKRLSEAQIAVEKERLEKEALRSRLVDDHLREHIRVLQKELDQTREEIVRVRQRQTDDISRSESVSSTLAEQLKSFAEERSFYEAKVTALGDQLAAADRALFDAKNEVSLMRNEHANKVEALERRLFVAEINSHTSGHQHNGAAAPTTTLELSPQQLQEQQQQHENDGAKDAASTSVSPLGKAATAYHQQQRSFSPPRAHHRSTGTQADDPEKVHLYRRNEELSDSIEMLKRELDDTQGDALRARSDLEDKLIRQMQDYEGTIAVLQKQIKVAQFKANRTQQQCAELQSQRSQSEQSAAEVQSQRDALTSQAQQLEKWRASVEREQLSAQMETDALKAKVRSLQRALNEQREAYDAKVKRMEDLFEGQARALRQQQQQQMASSTTPRISSARSQNVSPPQTNRGAQQQLTMSGGGGGSGLSSARGHEAQLEELLVQADDVLAQTNTNNNFGLRQANEATERKTDDNDPASINAAASGNNRSSSRGVADASSSSGSSPSAKQQQLQRLQRLKELDDALLRLHCDSLRLDEKEHAVRQQHEKSAKALQDRLVHCLDAAAYWRENINDGSASHCGPNGEPPGTMLAAAEADQTAIRGQLQRMDEALKGFFREFGEARNRLFAQSSELLQERSRLHGGLPLDK